MCKYIAAGLNHFIVVMTAFCYLSISMSQLAQAGGSDETDALDNYALVIGRYTTETDLCERLLSYAASVSTEPTIAQCTIGLSEDDGFTTPAWEELDPREHINKVKELFAWSLIRGNWIPESRELNSAARRAGGLSQEMMDHLWVTYSRNLAPLVENGQLDLARTKVVFRPGARAYTVYRIMALNPSDTGDTSDWIGRPCATEDGAATQYSLLFDVSLTDSPPFGFFNNAMSREIFFWNDSVYIANFMRPGLYVQEVILSKSAQPIQMKNVCSIAPNWTE